MRVTVEVGPLAPPNTRAPVVVGVVVDCPTDDVLEALDLSAPALESVRLALDAAGFHSDTSHQTVHREPSWT